MCVCVCVYKQVVFVNGKGERKNSTSYSKKKKTNGERGIKGRKKKTKKGSCTICNERVRVIENERLKIF